MRVPDGLLDDAEDVIAAMHGQDGDLLLPIKDTINAYIQDVGPQAPALWLMLITGMLRSFLDQAPVEDRYPIAFAVVIDALRNVQAGKQVH